MISSILLIFLSGSLWWWYFELIDNARWLGHRDKLMFRRQLILSWVVTIITVAYLAYFFLGSGLYEEVTWL